MNIWNILQINPTTNKKDIKKAYSKLLKIYHPEDDPVKFNELQNAYQQAMQYANGTDVKVVKQDDLSTIASNKDKVQLDIHSDLKDDSNIISNKDKVQFDIQYDFIEQPTPPIPIRDENLFVGNDIDKKTDFDDQKYSRYIKDNLLSKLPKQITYQDFVSIFDDMIIQSYLNNQEFKEELEKALIKRKYIKDERQLILIKEKAIENGMPKLEETMILNINTLHNKKGAKIYAFMEFLILFGLIVFSFLPTDTSNNDKKEQISQIEKEIKEINESYLNGYHIEDDYGLRVLMDENDKRIIENVVTVKYTQSSVVILYADDRFIAYDTLSEKSKSLNFEDVIPLEIRIDGKSEGYGLACLKDEKWYLADLSGNIKEELSGDIKGANSIEYVDDKPTLVTINE